jgi:predicted protein tyrosine phosphatase
MGTRRSNLPLGSYYEVMNQVARKQFEVRSARNAEFFRSDCPWAAISITSGDEFPALSEDNRVGLLRLVFEDITQPDAPRSFTPAQAAEILDFVAGVWDHADMFLIHCDVGLSRSPAVAAALSKVYYGDDGEWFELDFPNRLVYDVLVETHSRRSEDHTG